MSTANDICRALEIGCPVLAAQMLLESDDPGVRYQRILLKRGELELALPATSGEAVLIDKIAGRALPRRTLRPGVYCLAAYRWGADTIGAVQNLEIGRAQSSSWTGFDAGCCRGEEAALAWILSKAGLRDLRMGRSYQPRSLVGGRPIAGPAEKIGESAGLAAAIATIWDALSDSTDERRIAATGRVSNQGRVLPVGHVKEKVDAIIRETPSITHVLVPADSSKHLGTLPSTIKLIEVETVAGVLDELFPEPDTSKLAVMDEDTAAQRAADLEFARQHAPAFELAQTLLQTLEQGRWSIDGRDALEAEITARMILAINLTHSGEKAAVEEFAKIDALVKASGREIRDINVRCELAAIRVSTLIDQLDFNLALETCLSLAQDYKHAAGRPCIAFLGSWSRALAAAGQKSEAIERAREQVAIAEDLGERDKAHCFQARCNMVGALLSDDRPTDDDLQEVRVELDRAENLNARLPESAARTQNEAYLRLWRARYYARTAEPERARSLVKSETGGWFPEHHILRFVAEALLADGQLDEALETLKRAREGNVTPKGSFVHLVLDSCAAIEAIARIDHQRGEWEELARHFLRAFAEWAPQNDYVPEGGDAGQYRAALAQALRVLPY